MKIPLTIFDLETTSKEASSAELLTGYFKTILFDFGNYTYEVIDSLYVECKPEKYLHESFPFHKIPEEEAAFFPAREDTLRKICKYITKHRYSVLICHAHASMFGRYGHFDWTVIHNNMAYISDQAYYWFQNQYRTVKVISTHTMAKKVLGLRKNGLDDLSLHFGLGEFQHHNCKEDVDTTLKIFVRIVHGLPIFNINDLYDFGHYNGTRNWDLNGVLI